MGAGNVPKDQGNRMVRPKDWGQGKQRSQEGMWVLG